MFRESEQDIQLQRMMESLEEIRRHAEQTRSAVQQILSVMGEVYQRMARAEGLLEPKGIRETVQEIERLQEALKNMHDVLNSQRLDRIRALLKESQEELRQTIQRTDDVCQTIRQIREGLRRNMMNEKQATDELSRAIENTTTVLRRAMSHLQESSPAPEMDLAVRSIADLIHGSLRLASIIFDAHQLRQLSAAARPLHLDLLRKRWGDWLRELAQYIRTVGEHTGQIAVLEGGTQADAFRAALEDFQQACRMASHPSPPPFPGRARGSWFPSSEPPSPSEGSHGPL